MPVSLYGVHTKSIPSQSFSILIKADSSAFSFEARATISRITSSFDCKPASRAFSKVRMEEVLVSGDGDGVGDGDSDENFGDTNSPSGVSSGIDSDKSSSTTLRIFRISFQCRSFSASLDNVSNAGNVASKFSTHLSKRKTTSSRCSFRMRFNFTNRAFVFSIFSRTESTSTSTMAECIHSVEMDWKVSNCSHAFSLIVNSRFASSSARKVKEVDISNELFCFSSPSLVSTSMEDNEYVSAYDFSAAARSRIASSRILVSFNDSITSEGRTLSSIISLQVGPPGSCSNISSLLFSKLSDSDFKIAMLASSCISK